MQRTLPALVLQQQIRLGLLCQQLDNVQVTWPRERETLVDNSTSKRFLTGLTHHGGTMQRRGTRLGHRIYIHFALIEQHLADLFVTIACRIVQRGIVAIIPCHGLTLLDELPHAFHFIVNGYKKEEFSLRVLINTGK